MAKTAKLESATRSRRERAPLRGLAGLLAVAFVAPALAEDADHADVKTLAGKPSAFSWAGMYMGVNFGAGIPSHVGERIQAASGFAATAFDLYPTSRERSGSSFGAQVGYGWQFGPWVVGVGADLNFLDGRGGPTGTFPAPLSYWPLGVYSYSLTHEQNAKYFASFRTRFGFALDRTLFYVTGGVAAGGSRGPATLILNFGGPGSPFTASMSQSSRMKYVLGAGLEYAFADNWSTRLEYFFLNQSLNTQVFDNGSNFQYVTRTRNENHILRLGLNYNLGPRYEATGLGGAETEKVTTDGAGNGGMERYSAHGQTSAVLQGYPKFPAPYSGPNSFCPQGQARFGSITNLFLGVKLWEGGGAYINPEIDTGYQLSNAVGAAASVSGAATSVGRAAPYMRFQRYFYRQIIGLNGGAKQYDPDEGSGSEALESTQNQLSGKVDHDRIILTVGKFSVPDVFDDNKYAHDPITGFLNVAVNSLGAFDYAADAWGYTYGAAAEWKQDWWSARAGVFQLSQVPTGANIEPVLLSQFMGVAEFEGRYKLLDRPGVVKFLAFGDNGYLSKMDEVLALAHLTGDLPPRVDPLRKRRLKTGGGINIEQQLMPGLGIFLRASIADGRYETVDFTDIDRSLSFGFVAAGELWGRATDEIGGAAVFSGLSGARVRYFANGGVGTHIGDGAIAYASEKVLETYYKFGLSNDLDVTLDYQFLHNPAYNHARGPINIFALRLRASF